MLPFCFFSNNKIQVIRKPLKIKQKLTPIVPLRCKNCKLLNFEQGRCEKKTIKKDINRKASKLSKCCLVFIGLDVLINLLA